MSFRKAICFILTIFICVGFLAAEDLDRRVYESKRHVVQMKAILNDNKLSTPLNIVEVAIYDKQTGCFWYERFIIDGDKDYLLSEYETNPDLNISHLLNVPIVDRDIDGYANAIKRDINDISKGLYPENYCAVPHDDGTYSYMAYSRTSKDATRMRNGIGK